MLIFLFPICCQLRARDDISTRAMFLTPKPFLALLPKGICLVERLFPCALSRCGAHSPMGPQSSRCLLWSPYLAVSPHAHTCVALTSSRPRLPGQTAEQVSELGRQAGTCPQYATHHPNDSGPTEGGPNGQLPSGSLICRLQRMTPMDISRNKIY